MGDRELEGQTQSVRWTDIERQRDRHRERERLAGVASGFLLTTPTLVVNALVKQLSEVLELCLIHNSFSLSQLVYQTLFLVLSPHFLIVALALTLAMTFWQSLPVCRLPVFLSLLCPYACLTCLYACLHVYIPMPVSYLRLSSLIFVDGHLLLPV